MRLPQQSAHCYIPSSALQGLPPAYRRALTALLHAPNALDLRACDITVCYFGLSPSMECHIPGLLRAQLGCYGGLTGDPWRNAVFLYLTEGMDMDSDAGDGNAIQFRRELCSRPALTNICNAEKSRIRSGAVRLPAFDLPARHPIG